MVVGLLSLPGRHAPAEESPRRNTVVAGSQYAGGGLHRLFFGRDYRDLFPEAWDVTDTFGQVSGNVGTYPYMEAAQRMPGATVRGRRLRLGQRRPAPAPRAVSLLVPAHFGVFGFADAGRVWLEGEISGTWHTGFGGGVWFSLLAYRSAFSAGLAHGEEEDLFHVQGGFTF